jgi:hypothetical protein
MMKRTIVVRIAVFIFIAVLLLLIGHFFLHGFEKDHGHCLLCELLTIGFPCIEQNAFLLFLLFVAIILLIKPIQLLFFSRLQTSLRAPPICYL